MINSIMNQMRIRWMAITTQDMDQHHNEICPHCGGACFPKRKQFRVKQIYFYKYFWFECGMCYYQSPRSTLSVEDAREKFKNRIVI